MAETAYPDDVPAGAAPVMAGVLGALVPFAALTFVATSRNGWVFEYALDDVYIHLAMAEQIALGGYGVNPGEVASAASSPLYPLLLTPFAGTEAQRWLPLLWNIVAVAAAGALLGAAFAKAGLGRAGVALAAVAPFALTMYVVAFSGMENMGLTAAALAIVVGLWATITSGKVGWLLVTGVVLASALRFEGLAPGMAAAGLLLLLGRLRAGLGIAVLSLMPILIFAGYLTSLGLHPVPNSILAKIADTGPGGPLAKLAFNSTAYGGRYLLALAVALALAGSATLTRDRQRGLFALAVATVGFAHLGFGSTGWMDRYENYAVAALVAGLALTLGTTRPGTASLAVAVALAGGVVTYAPHVLSVYAWNPAAIAAQQGQMARFAKDFVKAPVAVNDIGYLAWANPNPVLDLWGLASPEALDARLDAPAPGWAGPIARNRGVVLAMVYDEWLGDAVPPEWQRLGTLHLDIPTAFLGGRDVAFYATDPAAARQLADMLRDWETGLPARAQFQYAEAVE